MLSQNKEERILELQEKIRQANHYHYDSIRDYRNGDDVNMENLEKDIKKTDKLRKKLIELGGEVPSNPNLF
jgi:hypothetical protein